jgi:hypothetical protein
MATNIRAATTSVGPFNDSGHHPDSDIDMQAGMESDLTSLPSEDELSPQPDLKTKRKVANIRPLSAPREAVFEPRKKRLRKTTQPDPLADINAGPTEDGGDASFHDHIASRRSRDRAAKAKGKAILYKSESEDDKGGPSYSSEPPNKRKRSRKVTAEDDDSDAPVPKKTRKPRLPKPEPVYVIPEVERKETTFKGRLGRFSRFHFLPCPSCFVPPLLVFLQCCLSAHSCNSTD